MYNVPPQAGGPYGYPPVQPYGYPGYPGPYAPVPAGPPPPRVWTVFVAYVVAFLAVALAPVVVIGILVVILRRDEMAAAGPDEMQRLFESALLVPGIFLPAIASTQVALLGLTLCAALLSRVPWRKRLRLGRPKLPWYGYPIAVVGTLALGYGSGVAIEILGLGDEGALKMFQDALGGLRGWLLVTAALVVGLAPGFGEELLFRGYMQTRLTQRWGRLASIGVVSLLFGVIHMDVVQGSFVILLGLYLGELTERTGSVWPAIVCHTVNNSLSTLVAPLAGQGTPLDATANGVWYGFVIVCACAVVLLACLIYVMWRPLVPVDGAKERGFDVGPPSGLPYTVPQPLLPG